MNPHLEFLLSSAYDGGLAPAHREDLEKSGLTQETIRAQFIRSAAAHLIVPLLGFDVSTILSALLFPFRSPAGGFMDHIRMKIFPALTDADGHTIKYLQPKGTAPRLYFVATCLREVLEGEGPLFFVEGEKKACAVAQLGLAVVGFSGIEGWHQRGTSALLGDFDAVRLAGRDVKLLPDGDWQTNANVARGVRRFALALQARGAVPRLLVLPAAPIEAG